MKKFTKAIATFCAMAMVVSVFSATVFAEDELNAEEPELQVAEVEPAAEGEPAAEEPAAEEPTNDPVVQPINNPEEPAQANLFANGVITQSDIDNNGNKMPETAGTYTLSENIVVSKSAQISAAGSQVTIDLAGHKITFTGDNNLYTVGLIEEATVNGHSSVLVHGNIVLTIKDSVGNGEITAANKTAGGVDHWISIDGSYPKYGTEEGHRGGCILVQNSCTFKLEGGTISGFHSQSDGGAIHVSNGGHCEMSGGRITDCHSDSLKPADDGAGAISCHCTSKGTSIGNALLKTSEDEEAVVSTISLKGSLKITGGKIDNCSGKQGGAVRILRGDFEMTGGTIEDNTGLVGGGILYNRNNKGSFKISGNVVISGNHTTGNDAAKANLYIYDGSTITLNGNLDSTAKIEFGTSAVTSTIFNTNGKNYSIDSFVCNHAGYIAYASGNSIKIKVPFVEPKVNGYIIGIGGEILFKAYVDFGSASQSDVSINYTYSYTKAGSAEVVINKDVADFYSDTKGTYFVIPVESACMTAPITITLSCDGMDDKVYTKTVEDVAKESVTIDSSYEDLVNALLTYGGYAQVQLKINADTLPTVSGVDFTDPADFGLASSTYTPASDTDGAFGGASVSFLSKTEVKLRFLKSALGDTAPAMTVNYAEGSKTVEAVEAGNYYVYTLKGYDGAGFKASQYNVSFEYSVGNVSGEYSVYTYLQVIYGTGTQPMKNLAQAYYNFAVEAAKIA